VVLRIRSWTIDTFVFSSSFSSLALLFVAIKSFYILSDRRPKNDLFANQLIDRAVRLSSYGRLVFQVANEECLRRLRASV
jgi:hypothetical protein